MRASPPRCEATGGEEVNPGSARSGRFDRQRDARPMGPDERCWFGAVCSDGFVSLLDEHRTSEPTRDPQWLHSVQEGWSAWGDRGCTRRSSGKGRVGLVREWRDVRGCQDGGLRHVASRHLGRTEVSLDPMDIF